MRIISTLLIVSVAAFAMPGTPLAGASAPMSSGELTAAVAGNFWGGLVCGAAVAGAGVGTVALVTAVGAGTTVGLGVAFGYSVSLHVATLCAFL